MARKIVPISSKVPHAQEHFQHNEYKIEERLFRSIDSFNKGYIYKKQFIEALREMGLGRLNSDLKSTFDLLDRYSETDKITLELFVKLVKENLAYIDKALTGGLIIPDFKRFTKTIEKIYHQVAKLKSGEVAGYIPQLARISPNLFSVSVCTIDGQKFSYGDSDAYFSIQSTCKTVNYCLAHKELGEQMVHKYIGKEPSGRGFNVLRLNKDNRPHNPFINSGAIMACSLIRRDLDPSDRFDYVMQAWTDLAGGLKPQFNNAVYLSERHTADRNFAIGYFMQEKKAFPDHTKLEDVLEFYFQCCSIEMTTEHMAIVGATFANSGLCELNHKEVFDPKTVKNCLSLMNSCGLYDFSGEFAFTVGLPAKSGVSGAIMIVIPNVMGICIYSPPVDDFGNSVRGVAFAKALVEHYNFHNYDSLVRATSKIDPRRKSSDMKLAPTMSMIWAASQGNLTEVQRLVAQGVNINQPDYDGRTALHLAASHGQLHVVNYLLNRNVMVNPVDDWGGTPLSDATKNKFHEIVKLLHKYGAKSGNVNNKNYKINDKDNMFEGYQSLHKVYDEYFKDQTFRKSKELEQILPALQNVSIKKLIELHQEAKTSFKQKGITYKVYGKSEIVEDVFPFDLIPRIVSAKEWDLIEKGLNQRIRALNAFLEDIYGAQEIFKEQIIPESLLLECPSYFSSLKGIVPRDKIHIHIAGFDLIRDSNGEFCVLEDNLCTPSGISYLLENRKMMKELVPNWFLPNAIREVETSTNTLRDALLSFASSDAKPVIVVLTPGVYNSAYFEHQYLAKAMNFPLVENSDLVVEKNIVYWRSPRGKKKVDVIYKRIADNFIDPTFFRKDSLLGVPGIVNAYREGNVVLANALGNGVADDKAFYHFLPEMIEYYLDETILLPQIKTYLATDKEDRAYMLAHTDKLVIKRVDEAGGHGIYIGSQTTKKQLEEIQSKIKKEPRLYVAQPLIQFSTIPTLTNNTLNPHRADLRVYAFSGKKEINVIPGGLTRVALGKDSYIVNSSQGGGSKDTWVIK